MDPHKIVHRLIESEILKIESDGSAAIAADFEARVEPLAESIADDPTVIETAVSKMLSPSWIDRLTSLADERPDVVSRWLALHRSTDLPVRVIPRVIVVLEQVERGLPRSEGAPDGFLPVHADQLWPYLSVIDRAVVYVWRDDCRPCETVQEQLDALFADGSPDIALLSVYGPAGADILFEEFDVIGAPATLFVRDGTVKSRLYSETYAEILTHELESLMET